MDEGCTSFLSLPLELREQVYKDVLVSQPNGVHLLGTCREIYSEAQKFLYRKSLTFQGQQDLYRWLDEDHKNLLVNVQELVLEIRDVDLDVLLKAPQDNEAPRSGLRSFGLYETDLQRLRSSFVRLPNVESLTIRAPADQHSFLYAEYLTGVLGLISMLCPKLVDLRLEGNFHYQDLGFMTSLKYLNSFSFDGFSSSSPNDTANILAKMQRLTRLSLVSQRDFQVTDYPLHHNFPVRHRSITGEVMQTMKRLHSFSVAENVDCSSPEIFFTANLLCSLHDLTHLSSLSITLSHTPEHDTLMSLAHFLCKASIKRLELDWPDLSSRVLEDNSLLTNHLTILWLRATAATDASDLLKHIMQEKKAGGVPCLQRLVFMRTVNYHSALQSVATKKDSGVEGLEEKSVTVSTSNENKGARTVEELTVCLRILNLSFLRKSKTLWLPRKGCETPASKLRGTRKNHEELLSLREATCFRESSHDRGSTSRLETL